MQVAFDALPLIGQRMTGIGYCEAGQIQALADCHPDSAFYLQYFAIRREAEKLNGLRPTCVATCIPVGDAVPAICIGWCPTSCRCHTVGFSASRHR